MLAGVYVSPGKFEVVNRAEPDPGPGQVLVRNELVGICGSDLTIIGGHHPRARPGQIIGHESVGTVVARGPGVDDFALGTHVVPEPLLPCGECATCRRGLTHVCEDLRLYGVEAPGALAEFSVYEAEKLHVIDSGVPLFVAVLTEPLAVGVHALNRSGVRPGSSVGVIGGGAIGALCALLAEPIAGRVVVAERSAERRSMLAKLGLSVVEDLASCEPPFFDVIFECAGVPSSARSAVRVSRPQGTIVLVAIQKQELVETDLRAVSRSEITMMGSRVYSSRDMQEAIQILERRDIDVTRFSVSTHLMKDSEAAFMEASEARQSLKTLIAPRGVTI